MRILIAEDQPEIVEIMRRFLSAKGHEVAHAYDGAAALRLFEETKPDLVFSDVRMPGLDGLSLLKKIRERNPDTIVVIVTGEGSENCAIEALRHGANNYLQKPFAPRDLLPLVNKYEGLVGTRALNRALRQWITRRSFSMRIENRPHLSTEIARLLVAETGERIPPDDRLDITLGLDELLMNAVEHGNLGITAEEKRQALTRPEGLQQLYQERLADPARAARRVAIDFTEDAAGLEWIITDEGAGFDWRSVPDPTADGNVMDMCGRGIFLCRVFFDELEYSGRGNRVRIRKKVD